MDPELKKTLDALTASLGAITKRLDTGDVLAKFSADERAHYDALTKPEEKDAFLKLDEAGRKAVVVAKVNDTETITVEGQTIAKRDCGSPAVFAVLKALQGKVSQATTATEHERTTRELSDFTKRAEDLYKNLPGEPAAKGKALHALGKLDEASRTVIESMLAAGNKAFDDRFTEIGNTGSGNVLKGAFRSDSAAERAIETATQEVMKRDKSDHATAYAKVLDEKPELYSAYEDERIQAIGRAPRRA